MALSCINVKNNLSYLSPWDSGTQAAFRNFKLIDSKATKVGIILATIAIGLATLFMLPFTCSGGFAIFRKLVEVKLGDRDKEIKILGLDTKITENEFDQIENADELYDKDTTESRQEENIEKNRYGNILPYNENRVILESGNYINASRVTPANGAAYICTQGPMENTVVDFWEMVWQEDTPVIVMVADLKEKKRNKCSEYWPGFEVKQYGEILVECTEEKIRYAGSKLEDEPGLTLRTFRMTKGDVTKVVHQIKIEKWPDHGVVDVELISTMIDDTNKLRTEMHAMDKPIIVHCSAGIGRTGTFVAEHHLTAQIEKALLDGENFEVNVAETIIELRNTKTGRRGMVQTYDQYNHIHDLIRLRHEGDL